MVLCRRQIPSLQKLMPPIDTSTLPPEQVCQSTNQARLSALFSQLAILTDYATEVFTNVLKGANDTHVRIQDLAKRTQTLQQSLPNTRQYYSDPHILEKMNNQVRTAFSSNSDMERELVTPKSIPQSMQLVYKQCEGPPNFHLYAIGDAALKQYTNPNYFIEQWVAEQREELAVLQIEKKKRRKEKAEARRIKKKAEAQANLQSMPKIQRKVYDPTTGKAIEVETDGAGSLDQTVMDETVPGEVEAGSDAEGSDEEGVQRITVSFVRKNKMKNKNEVPDSVVPFLELDGAPTVPQQGDIPLILGNVSVTPLPSPFEDTQAPPSVSIVPDIEDTQIPPEPEMEPPEVPAPTDYESDPIPPPLPPHQEPVGVIAPMTHRQSQVKIVSAKPPPPPPPPSAAIPLPPPPAQPSPSLPKIETKPIIVETTALLDQIRSGIQKAKLTHVDKSKPSTAAPQQAKNSKDKDNDNYGFNSSLVDNLLRLRKDIDDSSSSDSWDDDELSED